MSDNIIFERRQDPVTGEWVTIASVRGSRPHAASRWTARTYAPTPEGQACPFCPGNEGLTPTPEIRHYSLNGQPWDVRVVPNKFPFFRIEENLERRIAGMFQSTGSCGAHEIIVDTRVHETEVHDMPDEALSLLFTAYQERSEDLAKDKRFQYVHIFKNCGEAAGATVAHPHSQVIALPTLPDYPKKVYWGLRRYFEEHKTCGYCDMVQQELTNHDFGDRVIAKNGSFIAIIPYPSKFSYGVHILPVKHQSHFGQASREEIALLTAITKDVMAMIDGVCHNPPFNWYIRTAPCNLRDEEQGWTRPSVFAEGVGHWWLTIRPKLTELAGLELGIGEHTVSVPPELAAAQLRGYAERNLI